MSQVGEPERSPSRNSALPPTVHDEAAPKGISKRTSYLRVRLAFHPYPQVIPSSCDMSGFGPPVAFRRPSPCPWIAHPVSGLVPAIKYALFGLAFAMAPAKTALTKPLRTNSLAHSTKGTRSSAEADSHSLNALHFRNYFIPLFGVLFTFPSRYYPLLISETI